MITEGGDRLTEGARVSLPGDRPSPMIACAADMKKLCNGKQGREAFMCLRENQAKASADVQGGHGRRSRRRRGGGGVAAAAVAGQAAAAAAAAARAAAAACAAVGGGFTPSPEMQAARAGHATRPAPRT